MKKLLLTLLVLASVVSVSSAQSVIVNVPDLSADTFNHWFFSINDLNTGQFYLWVGNGDGTYSYVAGDGQSYPSVSQYPSPGQWTGDLGMPNLGMPNFDNWIFQATGFDGNSTNYVWTSDMNNGFTVNGGVTGFPYIEVQQSIPEPSTNQVFFCLVVMLLLIIRMPYLFIWLRLTRRIIGRLSSSVSVSA